MNRLIKKMALLVCTLMVTFGYMSHAGEIDANVDFVSAYVFQGVTYNDGPVIQPSLETTEGAMSFGVWFNYDADNYGEIKEDTISEIDTYVVYDIPVEAISLSATYIVFSYPHYDYETEQQVILTGVADSLPLSPFVTAKYGFDGAIEDTFYTEAGLSQNLSDALEVSALVAYISPEKGQDGLSHWEASMGYSLNSNIGAKVTYIGLIDDEVLVRSNEGGGYDVDLLASISISHTF